MSNLTTGYIQHSSKVPAMQARFHGNASIYMNIAAPQSPVLHLNLQSL